MKSKRRRLWIGMVLLMLSMAASSGGDDVLTPRIINVTPTSGPNEGGTVVTINGEGFNPPVQVFFGNQVRIEAAVLDETSTRVVVMAPSATGFNSIISDLKVDVTVVNLNSGQETSLYRSFWYGR